MFVGLHKMSPPLDSKINYQITDGNVGAAFDIDQVTGTVTVKKNLDYETTKRVSDNL